jgi:F-type H+-transporting ATPase subunit a
VAKKKGCLGCSLPVAIGLTLAFLVVFGVSFAAGPLGRSILGDLNLPGWLSVEPPQPHLAAPTLFHILGFPVSNTMIATWITILLLVGISFAVTRRMKIVPGRLQAAFEFLMGWLYDFCRENAGEKDGRKFFPFIATIFLFVGFNAWLALIPGYQTILIETAHGHEELIRAANSDINTPLALALLVFVVVEFYGFKRIGIRYLSKFFNFSELWQGTKKLFKGDIKGAVMGIFSGFMIAFAGLLELLSEFIRIVSLTFRLFGNMTAGEILLLVITFLVPWFLPVPFYGLEVLIGFIQALIFSGLTLIYLTMAVTPHSTAEEH